MPLKRFISLILTFVILAPALANAAASGPWKEEIDNLHTLNESFYNICFDEKGSFLKDHIISHGSAHLDCNKQALALEEHFLALKTNIQAYTSGAKGPISCEAPSQEFAPTAALEELSSRLNVNQCKKESDSRCAQGMVCNAMSSFMFGSIGLGETVSLIDKGEKLYKKLGLRPSGNSGLNKLKSCAKQSSGGDCTLNLLRGVWDSLYTTVDGMWALLKFGYKKAKQGVSYIVDSIGDWFSDIEDSTSEKMMAAQNVDDNMLDKFLDDPLEFVAELAKTAYKAIVQAAKDHYGCEKWSGAPFVSKCLRPMGNWDCASCNQKMNVVCGVGGFVVGEVVTAYLTGGAVAAVDVAGKSALRLGSKGLSRVARALKVIPKADEAIEVASKASNLATRTGKALGKYALASWKKLKNAISFKEVAKAARKLRLDLVKSARIIKKNKVYKGAAKGAEMGFSPFKSYLHAMDEAFNKGFYHTHQALGSGHNALRLSTISNLERSIKSGLDASNSKVRPKALAKDYARVVLNNNTATGASTEAAAKEIHKVWKKHYAHRKGLEPEMFRPYEKLSAENKIKTAELLKSAIKSKGSKEFQRDHFKTYIFNLEVELAKEKLFLFISKDNRLKDYVGMGEHEFAAIEAFRFISMDKKMREAIGLPNVARFKDLSADEQARLINLVKNSK